MLKASAFWSSIVDGWMLLCVWLFSVLDSFGNFVLSGLDFPWFLLESLILAQDERWRRA